jgi:thiol:disulfide interchange protein DsbA
MKRREFSAGMAMVGLLGLGGARAQGAPVEGQQYARLNPPVPPEASGKIDVVEFFSYACPHCNALEPTLEAWAKGLPADVHFHRIPVPFLANHQNFQRLYFSLEAMNAVDAMQQKVFNAVHVDHQRLDKPEEMAALLSKSGLDGNKFLAMFNSFGIAAKVRQADQLSAAWKLDGVPTLGVQGRYATSPGQAQGGEQALKVVDWLVQLVRSGK